MSYNTELQQNNTELQDILDIVNALPDADTPAEIVLQSKTVTPSKSTQEVIADANYTALEKVTVEPIPSEYIVPNGIKEITENGTHDAREYESVAVNVPIPDGYIVPSGTLVVVENGEYDVTQRASVEVNVPSEAPNIQPLEITENGTYTAPDGVDGYSPITVNVASGGGGSDLASILFSEKTFVEHTITDIPADGFRGWQFVEKIDMPKVTSIGQYACYNCVGLKEIDFPLCETIGNYCFYNNTDVTRINMPKLKTTGTNALRQLTSLVSVNLPALTAINGTVFQKCTMLEKADFAVVKSVGANAFNGCSALTALILRGDAQITLANVNALTGTPIAGGTGYVYFNRDRVESQKAMTNWSNFATQIRAIEDYPDICGG